MFKLDKKKEYISDGAAQISCFSDFYPEGHQSGVTVVMCNERIAANGDVRFEPTPGQWQPLPKLLERKVTGDSIIQKLKYPDERRDRRGFNPLLYPDYEFEYEVSVRPALQSVEVVVNLREQIPEEYIGKLFFNLELFPGKLFGKSFIFDGKSGTFPRQPLSPAVYRKSNYQKDAKEKDDGLRMFKTDDGQYNPLIADDIIGKPYGEGRKVTIAPEDDCSRFSIESKTADIKLYDGRFNHNNGWFVLSSEIPAKKTKEAIKWIITPNVVERWCAEPTIQISQVGYHPNQPKKAVIELDVSDKTRRNTVLYKITENGAKAIRMGAPTLWGKYLRYKYLILDFSDVKEEGLYKIRYGKAETSAFRISEDVYDRGVWQPVLEYFLPVQMCHMRVADKYRVWHGCCHMDDAVMAAENVNHFDGYIQRKNNSSVPSGKHVHGLNCGGWHDAGDYDLRIESQVGEMYNLAVIYDEFGLYLDSCTIDQENHNVEIHQPDGKNDLLEQIEHGAISVVAGYKALGELYRGIICRDIRQYVLLGDASVMTDGKPGKDDRLVFTEDNPMKELSLAGQLAVASKALKKLNPALAKEVLEIAENCYKKRFGKASGEAPPWIPKDKFESFVKSSQIGAAVDMYLGTGKAKYKKNILDESDFIKANSENMLGRIAKLYKDEAFRPLLEEMRGGALKYAENLSKAKKSNPYEVPSNLGTWGVCWGVQRQACDYYFIHKAFPELFDSSLLFNSLNYILGCHPGSNNSSFASGVGAKSMTTAYGANRADWSYIPGGVPSGTVLIKPDLPELLDFPFLWQQGEYVIGGGSSNFLFLVQAVIKELKN